jgi:hypothetical protein
MDDSLEYSKWIDAKHRKEDKELNKPASKTIGILGMILTFLSVIPIQIALSTNIVQWVIIGFCVMFLGIGIFTYGLYDSYLKKHN